jgi:hypothetical protein
VHVMKETEGRREKLPACRGHASRTGWMGTTVRRRFSTKRGHGELCGIGVGCMHHISRFATASLERIGPASSPTRCIAPSA